MTKKWSKEEIRSKLETVNSWLYRGLLAIYERQTADEQASDTTREDNGVGFNGIDSMLLSSYAKQYKAREFLTPKQIVFCRKKMLKYAGQLTRIANGEV